MIAKKLCSTPYILNQQIREEDPGFQSLVPHSLSQMTQPVAYHCPPLTTQSTILLGITLRAHHHQGWIPIQQREHTGRGSIPQKPMPNSSFKRSISLATPHATHLPLNYPSKIWIPAKSKLKKSFQTLRFPDSHGPSTKGLLVSCISNTRLTLCDMYLYTDLQWDTNVFPCVLFLWLLLRLVSFFLFTYVQ